MTDSSSPVRFYERFLLPKRSRERNGLHCVNRIDHNRPVFPLARCLTYRGDSAAILNGELSFANSIR